MGVEIVPAVLAGRLDVYRRRLRHVQQLHRTSHLDITDGRFVPSRSLTPATARRLVPAGPVDVHLMVNRPEDWLAVLRLWPTRRVIIHVELGPRLRFILALFRSNHLAVDLAINPQTPTNQLYHWISFIHGVQVMTVHPGRQGRPFQSRMVTRLKQLHRRYPRLQLSADGGIHPRNAAALVRAGASRLVVGSYLRTSSPVAAYHRLRQALS